MTCKIGYESIYVCQSIGEDCERCVEPTLRIIDIFPWILLFALICFILIFGIGYFMNRGKKVKEKR